MENAKENRSGVPNAVSSSFLLLFSLVSKFIYFNIIFAQGAFGKLGQMASRTGGSKPLTLRNNQHHNYQFGIPVWFYENSK